MTYTKTVRRHEGFDQVRQGHATRKAAANKPQLAVPVGWQCLGLTPYTGDEMMWHEAIAQQWSTHNNES
jgi:hypothetical protein